MSFEPVLRCLVSVVTIFDVALVISDVVANVAVEPLATVGISIVPPVARLRVGIIGGSVKVA